MNHLNGDPTKEHFELEQSLSSENEIFLLNKLKVGKRPSVLTSKTVRSHIRQGLIHDPVSLLFKILDSLNEFNLQTDGEKITEFLSLTQLLLPHLYRYPKTETKDVTPKSVLFDLLFRLLHFILDFLKQCLLIFQEGHLSMAETKTIRTNFSHCIEIFEDIVSKPRLLALALIEKEQNPQRFQQFQVQLEMLYREVKHSPHLSIKMLFKSLWEAAQCFTNPHALLFRIQNPLSHNLFGIHLMKQCALNNEQFPSLTLALFVHDEVSGVRFQTLEKSAVKLEYLRRVWSMPRHLFYAELWASALRYDTQCLHNTNRWLKCRTFLLIKIPRLLSLWNKQNQDDLQDYSFSHLSDPLIATINECNDIELSLHHISRFCLSLYQKLTPSQYSMGSLGTSPSTEMLLKEMIHACTVRGLVSSQRLHNLVSHTVTQCQNISTKNSNDSMNIEDKNTIQLPSDANVFCDGLTVENFSNTSNNTNALLQSPSIEHILQSNVLQTQQEVQRLLEDLQNPSTEKTPEFLSEVISCITNSLRTQWTLQEHVVTLILEILKPTNKTPMTVVSLLCEALCNESLLSILHYYHSFPTLLKYMIHYCDTYGHIPSPEAHEYFTSTFLLLLVLLEFYQVKIYSQNQRIVFDVLKDLEQENQFKNQHDHYTFVEWYREYLNNIVDGSVDRLGCGSTLLLLFLQPENPPQYTTMYGAWSVLANLSYVLKQVWQIKVHLPQQTIEDSKQQTSLISNDALMQGLITLFRTSPYSVPLVMLWIINNIYFSPDFTTQFAAGVLVALIDSFTPNQMGAADCPLLNNVKTALRLLLKKPFLGLFTHILTDLKPERDKFLKLIYTDEDRDDVERSFVNVESEREILEISFRNIVESPLINIQQFPHTQMAIVCSHTNPANFCNLILHELLTSVNERWCAYPQALRAAEFAAYLLGSYNPDVLIYLLSVAVIENCLPRVHTILEGQILAYCVFLAIVHSDLLTTLQDANYLTISDKRSAIALQHFLFGLTELLERVEKHCSVSAAQTSENSGSETSAVPSFSNNNVKQLNSGEFARIQPVLAFVFTFFELASTIETFLPSFAPSQRLGKILLKLKCKHLITSLFSLKTEKGRQELFEFYWKHSAFQSRRTSTSTHTTTPKTVLSTLTSTDRKDS